MKKEKRNERMTNSKKRNGGRREKIIVFFFILYLFAFIGLLIPIRPKVSEMEKRTLAKFPAFSLSSFLDGTYFSQIDTWYSDTFPFRETLIKGNQILTSFNGIKTIEITGNTTKTDEIPDAPLDENDREAAKSEEVPSSDSSSAGETPAAGKEDNSPAQESTSETENAEGVEDGEEETEPKEEAKTEINENGQGVGLESQSLGALMIMGNAAYEYYGFNQEKAASYITAINQLASALPADTNYYQMIVPTSMGVMLAKSVLNDIATSDQEQALKYFYGSFQENIHSIDVYPTLREHNGEYIYFRTDHHWTALGAYYAYREFCKEADLVPADLTSYETMDFPGFLGTFYNESQNPSLEADTLTAYLPKGTNDISITQQDGSQLQWNVIKDVSDYNQGAKYSAFIGGDNPLSVIENNTISDGSNILVLKESYGNAFVPFLVDHYQTVYVVDYRCYQENLLDLIQEKKIKNVLMLNYIDTTSAENNISKISALSGGGN